MKIHETFREKMSLTFFEVSKQKGAKGSGKSRYAELILRSLAAC